MRRVGIFIDVMNMYHCIKDNKLDYRALYEYAKEYGIIQRAVAYGCQRDNEADGFLRQLKSIGYQINYTAPKMHNGTVVKANRDMDICLGIIDTLDHLDVIILCSSDGDFAPVLQRVKNQGIHTVVIGADISNDLSSIADSFIELSNDSRLLLENKL